MIKAQKYDFCPEYGNGRVEESDDGDYVRSSDYDALAANNKRLREALVELMRVMPCLPSAAKQIDGMPDRYDAAIKSARATLADSKEGE